LLYCYYNWGKCLRKFAGEKLRDVFRLKFFTYTFYGVGVLSQARQEMQLCYEIKLLTLTTTTAYLRQCQLIFDLVSYVSQSAVRERAKSFPSRPPGTDQDVFVEQSVHMGHESWKKDKFCSHTDCYNATVGCYYLTHCRRDEQGSVWHL